MNTPQTKVGSGLLQVVIATIVPLAIAYSSGINAMVITDLTGLQAAPFVLVASLLVLIGSGTLLNKLLLHRVIVFWPFLAAIVSILPIWLWQMQAMETLVPGKLQYGYFLKPEGAKARFWVLNCPFWVGVACLFLWCIIALVSESRVGNRLSLVCMVPWWLAAFAIFALPSILLDGQGNGWLFI